jgi:NAD(P)-dependent dehydrogenase (short-subunit alcohol dehydrogenase family)
METGLRGRNAVITGGSKGIGKDIARGLAVEGVNVALIARGKETLEQTAAAIGKLGVRVIPIQTDVKNAESVKGAADIVAREFGKIHILVNNAGSAIRRMDRQITWPDTDWMDDINGKMMGMLRVTQSFLPHIVRDGTGRIINISGIAGSSVLVPALTHGFNNSAMNHVTKYLAQDLAAEKITVNAVSPGLVATEWREMWAENMGKMQGKSKEEFLSEYCKKMGILAGRWASMAEITDTVVFVASDRARYINGAKIMVDGGYSVNVR